jgi:hypothetical protein
MKDKSVNLTFAGDFSHDLVSVLLVLAKNTVGSRRVMKKIYKIMTESLENLTKHSLIYEKQFPAIFILGKDEDFYYIATGNRVAQNKVLGLKKKLEKVNHLDNEGLKRWYSEILINNQAKKSIGSGLGIIDMALKSKNKLEFNFQEIDVNHSFFTLKVKVHRLN